MSQFPLKSDWRYTAEDLDMATTPEEVHRALYGQLLHRMLPERLPHGWGLGFIQFEGDRNAAENYADRLKAELRWSRLRVQVVEIREQARGVPLHVVVLGPIGTDEWFQLPWEHQARSQYPKDVLFSEQGMNLVTEDLGGFLVLPGSPHE